MGVVRMMRMDTYRGRKREARSLPPCLPTDRISKLLSPRNRSGGSPDREFLWRYLVQHSSIQTVSQAHIDESHADTGAVSRPAARKWRVSEFSRGG